MARELIRAQELTRLFISEAETVRAVDEATLGAASGEFVCLFGHSGSGKTTLLNLFAGLDQASSGRLVVAGHDLLTLPEEDRIRLRRETVGVVHQSDFLIEEFTAAENVALPLEARGSATSAAIQEAKQMLKIVGLDGFESRWPRQLSGGQRQRVGIARALIGQRDILLADEPTGALDTANAAAVFQLLRRIADDGALVIVASHDPACQTYATRLIGMTDGRIVTDEPV